MDILHEVWNGTLGSRLQVQEVGFRVAEGGLCAGAQELNPPSSASKSQC